MLLLVLLLLLVIVVWGYFSTTWVGRKRPPAGRYTGTMHLEEYNIAIRHFHDSLTGLDSAMEEALLRCDKARLACKEARLIYEAEEAKRASSRSLLRCPEWAVIEEQYLLAVIAYGDALNSVQLRPRVANEAERRRIESARNGCNTAFKALEDHERTHRCRNGTRPIKASNLSQSMRS
jgi:hypothetical protein